MPRRNRPRGTKPARDDEDRGLSPELVVRAPSGWRARSITADRAVKAYRCPGCDHEIPPATVHVVAWREGDEAHRRHWHKGCWSTHLRTKRPGS